MNTIVINPYYTLIIATLVLLVGRLLVGKIKILQNFNIPEPVAGGLLAAIIIFLLYLKYEISLEFSTNLQEAFMLFFFSSIGLSADFSRLKAGGKGLIFFLGVVALFIVVQNSVGVGLASALGQNPIMGLITGSITLTGGHGTAGAWGPTLEKEFGIGGATGLGIAAATFGLVFGGLIGGPVARRLINKQGRAKVSNNGDQADNYQSDDAFESHGKTRLITADSAVETLALFAACLAFAEIIKAYQLDEQYFYKLPKFVLCLFAGVILRNVLTLVFKRDMFDRAVDVFGNASLSLFLAIALLDLKLWQLTGMAGSVTVILAVQTVVMILYATFVTYVLMGRDYDAAVLSAGHCGFGLGATPTAVANMQSITQSFGPSHKAFLIVPMVGAFFVDIINALILSGFVEFLKK